MRGSSLARSAVIACIAAVCVAIAPLVADEPREQDPGASGQAEAAPQPSPFVKAMGGRDSKAPAKVYTNEDLERLYGGESLDESSSTPAPGPTGTGEAKPAETAPAEEGSALDQLFAREQARKDHATEVQTAEDNVEAAKQRIVDLEKRRLAIRNPLLARPDAPEDEAEAEKWSGADAAGRVDQTDQALAAAREALAEAEAELAKLRASAP